MNRGNAPTPIRTLPRVRPCWLAVSLAATLTAAGPAGAEWDTPQTRLRPIGSPSAVDAYNPPRPAGAPVANAFARGGATPASERAAAGSGSFVRQAAMMQASGGFSMPPDAAPTAPQAAPNNPPAAAMPAPLTQTPALGPIAPSPQDNPAPLPRPHTTAPPPAASTPVAPPASTQPGMAPVPRSAPSETAPQTTAPAPAAAAGDYAPLAQPQLSTNFATMANCRNITPPSGYRSDRLLTCGPPVSYVTTVGASAPPPTYLPPPAQLGPAVTLPPATLPAEAIPLPPVQTVIPGSPGYRPLISFGQERYPVQVGQGIFGQPTAYVPGQSFRNAIRYLTW